MEFPKTLSLSSGRKGIFRLHVSIRKANRNVPLKMTKQQRRSYECADLWIDRLKKGPRKVRGPVSLLSFESGLHNMHDVISHRVKYEITHGVQLQFTHDVRAMSFRCFHA